MNKNRVLFLSMIAVCLTLVCAFLFTGRAEASPAAPIDLTLTQPDGATTFTARQWGDEWNNGIETVEGYSILQLEDGWWVYAEVQADGLLGPVLVESAPRRVGIDSPEGLPLNLRSTVVRENPNSLELMGLETPDLNSPQAPTLTNVKTLLLLAKFTGTSETYTEASFQSLMFSTTSSSVRKYYREISFNNMDIIPAEETCGTTTNDGVTSWTDLGYAHPDTGDTTDSRNQQIVKDVLIANDGCINFTPFDTNTNGYIDSSELQIIVVVAGYERSYSDAYSPSVWAHAWSLDGVGAPTLDGKVVGDYPYGGYAQFGEHHGAHQATIGVMAHEFGHAIDWPDLYDTDLSSNGVGKWSIMGYGSWNNTVGGYSGDSPAHADAWLKWYQGWITPTVVSGAQYDVSIAQAETNTAAYLLRPNPNGVDWRFYSHSGTGEFFLVENRQKAGYDMGLPGCGLLIWHIDESVTSTNSANANEDHALVWLEQADGLNELAGTSDYGDAGDPWPGSSDKYTFNYASTPNSRLYSGLTSSTAVHVDSTSCASSMQADLTYPTVGMENFIYLPLINKPGPPWTTIMSQDFEGSFPSSGWTVADKWTFDGYQAFPAKRTCRKYAGSYSGWMVGGGAQGSGLGCGANYPNDAEAWMIYGPFSTVGATAAQLNFQHWTNVETYYGSGVGDRFCAWVSGDNIYYNGWCFWGSFGAWNSFSLDLSNANYNNYLGLSSVWVAFTLQSDYMINFPEGAYVDNIVLRKCTASSCSSGAAPLFSLSGTPLDALDYFLDPFVMQFSGPAGGILKLDQ
ncbi:MAG: M6 family metalloprotease domain-containing protein [Anaerolineaceae bacterium]